MNKRLLFWCALVCCAALPWVAANAQTSSPANVSAGDSYAHEDEREVAPAPRKAIDDALADLQKNIAQVKPKAGPLDTKELEKALRDRLQDLKPPKTLKVVTSGRGRLVDPKDTGLYWDGLGMQFTGGLGKKYVWEQRLDIDRKKYALAGQPLYELEYEMVSQRVENPGVQPFGRTMRINTDYHIVVKVTLTFDPNAVENGMGKAYSGVGAATPESHTFAGAVSVTDRVER